MMEFGKLFILLGIVFIVIGLVWSLIGKLPGDFVFKKGNVTFYFPIMTSIVISIVLSLIFYFISRFR
ncbi:DUF2905 family protein [Melghiribacillus thermohalophilus]|uniref:DUF2905 family protein n=2 Tax=Melghiribacillus thermohalophilus TaxID=1324956 RepID=A0A4R3NBV3_9BACI|nr:DUF2905 family protein [Melghiribacillus thermohalophilus]